MEDPLAMFDDNFHISDSEMTYFPYPEACVEYQGADFSNLSCLFDPEIIYQTEPDVHLDNTLTRDSHDDNSSSISSDWSPELHDDLSNFFSEHLLSSPATGQRFATLEAETPPSGYSSMPLDRSLDGTALESRASSPPATPSARPAIFTSGFEPFKHYTAMNYGQVTPGNSPKDLRPLLRKSTKAAPTTRRQPRKRMEVADVTITITNAIEASIESEKDLKLLEDDKATVKKPTKSQRTSKKTTLESVAAKREAFLKRNKEAAYKCRVKTKIQRMEAAEREKVLTEDNASKGLEIEKLRSEVYGLKRLLLSHYRKCSDENLAEYWNGFRSVGLGEGVGAGRHEDGIVVGSVESFEDSGVDIDEEGRGEARQRHSDNMEDISIS
ncbi:hypothetical protein V502_05855 [Pseudogymnoascus sp. VKM F-4520 (FW-2644)]|nr:hypothetical protein V502_05855 [Pseudogymnoascus sp. VKM F-4520 (FW-2644)]